MKEINPNGIYDREDLAELFEVSPRTISKYYNKGLPKKKGIRGNSTTGREIMSWLEHDEQEVVAVNPKLLKFRKERIG